MGDARRSLVRAPDHHYDLIVMDAFSSDAIPVHLITREAVRLYLRKLAPGGFVAFHISNRHLDLEPVLAGIAEEAGLAGVTRHDDSIADTDRERGKLSSHWVVLAQTRDVLKVLIDAGWEELSDRNRTRPWTDDFSNIIGALKWR